MTHDNQTPLASKDQAACGLSASPCYAPSIFDRLKDCLVHGQGVVGEITPASLLEDELGLDSLDAVELGIAVEELFGFSREISEENILACKTVADVVALIERLSVHNDQITQPGQSAPLAGRGSDWD